MRVVVGGTFVGDDVAIFDWVFGVEKNFLEFDVIRVSKDVIP